MGALRTPQPAPHPAPQQHTNLQPIKPLTIPNQVIGSKHSFFGKAPFVVGPVRIGLTVTGDENFEPSATVRQLGPGETVEDIQVVYKPISRGIHHAKMSLVVAYTDSHVEEQTGEVTASARDLAAAPPDAIVEAAHHVPMPVTNPIEGFGKDAALKAGAPQDRATNQNVVEAIADVQLVGDAVKLLFDDRRTAVESVREEARAYSPPEAAKSMWLDLAVLAITLGTGGLGGTGAFLLEEAVREFAARTTARFVAKLSEQSLAKGVAAATKYLEGSHAPPSEGGNIAFFNEQTGALNKAERDTKDSFAKGLKAHGAELALDDKGLGSACAAAVAAFDAVRDSGASDRQKTASSLQFVKYQVRASMEQELWKQGLNKPPTTDMQSARHITDGEPRAAVGLLDLYLGDGPTSPIEKGELRGISKTMATHLLNVDLRTAGLPLRFHPKKNEDSHTGYGLITRDEEGVIRYGDDERPTPMGRTLDADSKPGDPEAQSIRGAERIVNSALSKTLAGWGAVIETDDREKK